jgi:hypothetical protein
MAEVKTMAENMAFDWRDFEKYGVEAVVLCNVEDEDKPVLGICAKGMGTYGGEEYILERLSYDYAEREGESDLSLEKWMYKHADKLASLIWRYINEGLYLDSKEDVWYADKVCLYTPASKIPWPRMPKGFKVRKENENIKLIMH